MNAPRHDQAAVSAAVCTALDIKGQIIAAGISEDDPDLATLLDSECDTLDLCRRLIRLSEDDRASAKALADLIDERLSRKARIEQRADRLRGIVLNVLTEIGEKRLDAPDFTVTVSAGKRAVVGNADGIDLPDSLCRIKREPDKTAIRAALEAGELVPGHELGNAVPSIRVLSR